MSGFSSVDKGLVLCATTGAGSVAAEAVWVWSFLDSVLDSAGVVFGSVGVAPEFCVCVAVGVCFWSVDCGVCAIAAKELANRETAKTKAVMAREKLFI